MNDWELDEVYNFFERLHDHSLSMESKDSVEWVDIKSGNFSVKSFYSSLASREANPFPHGMVWNSWAFIRVSFFAWEATWVKILTLDQLKMRGQKMLNRYYMCKEEEETSDHILFHCPKARILWQLIFALFGVQWVMHSSVRGLLLSWGDFLVGRKRKKAWKVALLCLFWSIWTERNRRAFENCECSNHFFKMYFLYLFWDWVRLYIGDDSLLTLDFVDWLGAP